MSAPSVFLPQIGQLHKPYDRLIHDPHAVLERGKTRAFVRLSGEGDLPGAFAPDAWFDFLNRGNPEGLLQICEHNSRDILGLAGILGCLCRIAADPLGEGGRYSANVEQLALCWQRALAMGGYGEEESRRARALLERGAALGHPRCCRKLAVEAEWRGGDITGALGLVERALAAGNSPAGELPEWLRRDLEGRRERLRAKAGAGRAKPAKAVSGGRLK
jgi:hypothetical protein